jgi:preprotein translocase SecE subunit
LTDLRRGFDFPKEKGPLGGSSLEEGWAQEGCSDSLNLKSSHDGPGSSTMAFSPFKFLQEVRTETAKVTWPSRRETTITTIMVFVMVALASIFFFAADQIIRYLVTFLLGIH